MSGTSCDGIDAAIVELSREGDDFSTRFLAGHTFSYEAEVRSLLLSAQESDGQTLTRLNVLLGELLAEAVRKVVHLASIPLEDIDLIGSHGHTIHHLPDPVSLAGKRIQATLQLGEPSIIAERTGIDTVADFRPRDMAAGGEGAPLVPYPDLCLFGHPRRGRIVLNIGGIANLTALPPKPTPREMLAFDTGPGNILMDALMQHLSHGQDRYDEGGALAASGVVQEPILGELLRHPFFKRQPPKSAGRENFHDSLFLRFLKSDPSLPSRDLMATLVALTAESIAGSIRTFLPPDTFHELIVSGGGVNNAALMSELSRRVNGLRIRSSDELGVPADMKEAMAFAILAHTATARRTNTIPTATGATQAVIAGKFVPGRLRRP